MLIGLTRTNRNHKEYENIAGDDKDSDEKRREYAVQKNI